MAHLFSLMTMVRGLQTRSTASVHINSRALPSLCFTMAGLDKHTPAVTPWKINCPSAPPVQATAVQSLGGEAPIDPGCLSGRKLFVSLFNSCPAI